MNKYLYFVAGAAIGSVVTFFAVKEHYKKKADDVIAAIREFHEAKNEAVEETKKDNAEIKTEYQKVVTDLGYNAVPSIDIAPKEVKSPSGTIEFISEEEYGNNEAYDAIPTYVYYANGILVDELGDEVSQQTIGNCFGSDFYQHFGDDDVLYIRNHESKCDFEIVLDEADWTPPEAQG